MKQLDLKDYIDGEVLEAWPSEQVDDSYTVVIHTGDNSVGLTDKQAIRLAEYLLRAVRKAPNAA